MLRKKLVNKEKFQFKEDERLPPPTMHRRVSVQSRLVRKSDNSLPYHTSATATVGSDREPQLVMANERMKTIKHTQTEAVGRIQTSTGTQQPKPVVPVDNDPVLDAVVAQLKSVKFSKEISNNNEQGEASKTSSACACERSLKLILCGGCGITFPGRLSFPCSDHPNNIYLLDVDECKGCNRRKHELMEYELPRGVDEGIKNPRIK